VQTVVVDTPAATIPTHRWISPEARRALILGWVLWVVVGVAGIAVVDASSDLWCEHEAGDSEFGELSWSIVPFGPVCTWHQRVNGFDERRGPYPFGTIWVLGVAAGPVAYVLVRRHEHDSAAPHSQPGVPAPADSG
jgi:hypothetical protein